jgi:hypothetical protein
LTRWRMLWHLIMPLLGMMSWRSMWLISHKLARSWGRMWHLIMPLLCMMS